MKWSFILTSFTICNNDDHNRFLHRNWWCGITPLAERSQVTTHICCILGWRKGSRRVTATVTTAFIPDIDIVISYGQVKSHLLSHRLCPVTQLKQASYRKKILPAQLFSITSLLSLATQLMMVLIGQVNMSLLRKNWPTCATTYVKVYAYTKSLKCCMSTCTFVNYVMWKNKW